MSSRALTVGNMAHLIPYYDVPGDAESETDHRGGAQATSPESNPSAQPERASSRPGAIEHGGPMATGAVLSAEDFLHGLTGSLEAAPPYEESLEMLLR